MSWLKFFLRHQADDISMVLEETMARESGRGGREGVKRSHESEPEGKLEGPFKGELISCLWADFEKRDCRLVLTPVSERKGNSSIKDHREEMGTLMISDRKKTRVAGWRIQVLREPSAAILEENADKTSDRNDPASGRFGGKKDSK